MRIFFLTLFKVIITVSLFSQEICNNLLDDDSDGFIDYFDKDCDCIDSIFFAGCVSDCEFIPDSFPKIIMKLKWQTELITDAFFGGIGNFVIDPLSNSVITSYSYGSKSNVEFGIKIIKLNDPKTISKIVINQNNTYGYSPNIAIGDVDKDGIGDIFVRSIDFDTRIERYDTNGKFYWSTQSFSDGINSGFFPKLADFNQDGIPELYIGNRIFNSISGNLLLDTKFSAGCNEISAFSQCGLGDHSIAADFTTSPGLELACGNMLYELNLINNNGEVGNTFNIINSPSLIKDGHTTYVDLDRDGYLDIIVSRSNIKGDGGLWVWNPRNSSIIASTLNENRSGIPFIGNIDNDCYPEIGVCNSFSFSLFKYKNNLEKQFNKLTSDESGFTGITMFDFNQDGKNELIYRDETFLKIVEGATGITIDSFEIRSGTFFEYPIVSDIDDDGQSEILVNGHLSSDPDSVVRIFCFESASSPWAPARKVWNQTGYHIINVNDDLTIPRQQQNNAAFFDTDSCSQSTCNQPYNSFMCQATYRDQNGCVRWPAMDMVTDIIDYICDGDSVTFRIEIRNQSTNTFRHDSVSLGLYYNRNDLPFSITQRAWEKSQDVDTFIYTIPSSGINKIRVRVNIPVTNASFIENIKGLTSVLECDYENNTDSIEIDLALKSLDLGPDITKCRTQVVTLSVPNDFVSYQWSDFSQENIYSTSEIGIHTLLAIDQCGRMYEDSVELKIDESLIPNLGSDIIKCEDELITYSVGNEYEWLQWRPAEYVSCDTCRIININADTSFQLIMIGNNKGCIDADSVLVNIIPLKKRIEQKFICRGDSTLFNGLYISDEGMYEYRTLGCDSLVTLNLLVIPPDSIMLPTHEICRGDSLLFLGTWYKDAINATVKLKNQYQCDSFITFELRVIDTLKTNESLSICQGDSIRIFDQWQSGPGVFSKSYQSARGCDSLAQVQLIVNSVFVNSDSEKICSGDSIFLFNEWEKGAGVYSKKYQTINGCDSTEQVQLIVKPLLVKSDSILICEGDSVDIDGQVYYDEGSYQTILSSTVGCDTIYNFAIKYSPLLTKTEKYSICVGDSILVNNKWIKEAGEVKYIIEEENCKTEITANIIVKPSTLNPQQYILCPDESITINNIIINESTEINYTLQSAQGCDSVIQAKVTKLVWPEPPIVELNCDDNVYNASIEAEGWNIIWIGPSGTPTSTSPATMITESPASVRVSNDNDCERYFDLNITDLPDLTQLPSFNNQRIYEGDTINVSLELYPLEWEVKWSPSYSVSCDTCFETTINVDTNTIITLVLKHLNGCTYTRTFEVIIEKEKINITIPNIINTNSSSSNSVWSVIIPDGYKMDETKVYDRWGNLVYVSKANIAWDGKINEELVSPGVFVYFILLKNFDGETQIIKGDLTVIH